MPNKKIRVKDTMDIMQELLVSEQGITNTYIGRLPDDGVDCLGIFAATVRDPLPIVGQRQTAWIEIDFDYRYTPSESDVYGNADSVIDTYLFLLSLHNQKFDSEIVPGRTLYIIQATSTTPPTFAEDIDGRIHILCRISFSIDLANTDY